MPYRHAHRYLIALILVSAFAFWPGYLASLRTAAWGLHFHGITATGWLLLLAAQSWSVHERRIDLHRALGRASLFYFPLFLAGTGAVLMSMARATGTTPFYAVYGARLAALDAPSVVLLAWLFHKAMAERRHAQRHARYLLATPIVLLPPVLRRIAAALPAFRIAGPEDFPLFASCVRIGTMAAIGCAALLYLRRPAHGRPFLVTGIVLAAAAVAFDTVGRTTVWLEAVLAMARLPDGVVPLVAGAGGALAAWSGWMAGRTGRPAPLPA